MALFGAYRRSLGETRPLSEAPGHLFDESDREALECLLDLVLYFFWDATLVTDNVAVRVSHDEWISVHWRDSADLAWLEKLLD